MVPDQTIAAAPAEPRAIATARTPGIDVARALAVLGMVLVNCASFLGTEDEGPGWLVWTEERIEGRAAALFVVLAGVGLSLRSRHARLDPALNHWFERRAVLERAGVLLLAGLLNLHLWAWDILHFYALYLALAAAFITAKPGVLWSWIIVFVVGAAALQLGLDYNAELDLWTPLGGAADLVFNGLHPIFPWMSFLLLGMWLGRLDLRERSSRNRVLVGALLALLMGELLGLVPVYRAEALPGPAVNLLGTWPRPPTPAFVLAAGGAAVAVLCICVAVTETRPSAAWVVALTATGQLAFTLYIGHAVAITITVQHGWPEGGASLAAALAYGVGLYAVGVAFSLWWRRRWAQGPLEALIRQVAGRTGRAPWGGALVSDR